jgi:uncharacterized membrane protein
MSELIAVGFKDTEEADRVLLRLGKLKKEYLIDLEDAVVVVRDETGKVHLKQSIDLVSTGTTPVSFLEVYLAPTLGCCSSIHFWGSSRVAFSALVQGHRRVP